MCDCKEQGLGRCWTGSENTIEPNTFWKYLISFVTLIVDFVSYIFLALNFALQ